MRKTSILILLLSIFHNALGLEPLAVLPESSRTSLLSDCVCTGFGVHSDLKRIDAKCLEEHWNGIHGYHVGRLSYRRTADKKSLILTAYQNLVGTGVKVLAVNDNISSGVYPYTLDIWFNNDLQPLVWRTAKGLVHANGSIVPSLGPYVEVDDQGIVCTNFRESSTSFILIENPSATSPKTTNRIEKIVVEDSKLLALGYDPQVTDKYGNYFIETYAIRNSDSGKYLSFDHREQLFFKQSKFFLPIGWGINLLDFDSASGLLAFRDTSYEPVKSLQMTFVYSILDKKIIEKLPVTHFGLFLLCCGGASDPATLPTETTPLPAPGN